MNLKVFFQIFLTHDSSALTLQPENVYLLYLFGVLCEKFVYIVSWKEKICFSSSSTHKNVKSMGGICIQPDLFGYP